MDTLVTLAPLLGLLGTVTGLIRSFRFLGNEELAIQAVTGGIAEALIATACGLGIAIFSLIPFNFFTSRVSNLEFELQTAATNLEVMLEAKSKEVHDENPEAKVFIRGDADSVHFNIIRVLDICRAAGFYKVAFEIKSEALKSVPGGR